jgi:hypothetical protein
VAQVRAKTKCLCTSLQLSGWDCSEGDGRRPYSEGKAVNSGLLGFIILDSEFLITLNLSDPTVMNNDGH